MSRLHPIMGNYLNMQGNLKTAPNENYAREVMQLFSIGLYMLQPDGTLMLDVNGQPIPTYYAANGYQLCGIDIHRLEYFSQDGHGPHT